jgi:HSP20 family protein
MPNAHDPHGWGGLGRRIDGLFRSAVGGDASLWRPNTDIYESDDGLMVRMELAGVSKKDLHIEVADRILIVRGTRAEPGGGCCGGRVYRQAEVEYGPFARTIPLPQWADAAKVDAQYRDGFLHVQVRRVTESEPRQVSIDIVDEDR